MIESLILSPLHFFRVQKMISTSQRPSTTDWSLIKQTAKNFLDDVSWLEATKENNTKQTYQNRRMAYLWCVFIRETMSLPLNNQKLQLTQREPYTESSCSSTFSKHSPPSLLKYMTINEKKKNFFSNLLGISKLQ